jgi:hypothetical protein
MAGTWNRDTVDTEIGFIPMREQIAILAYDHGEWILVIDSDDDEPEQAWKCLDAAIEELRRKGWEVVQDPASIRPSFAELEELDRFAPWGYRLKRAIQ